MKKNTLVIFSAAVLAAAVMAGCGNKKAAETTAAPATVTEAATETETEAATEAETEAPETVLEADFVIAGGDGAGLIAAIQAVKEGTAPSSVMIVERSGELGADISSMENFINASNTDEQYDEEIEDSFETFLADIKNSGKGGNNEELAEFVAESSEEALIWLRDLGIEMNGVTKEKGSSVARSYKAAGKEELPAVLKEALLKEAAALNIQVEYNTKVDEILFSEKGAVSGIKVTGEDGQKTVNCAALLITDQELLPLLKDVPAVFTTDAEEKQTGVVVNSCAEVADENGEAVPGLYAAGALIEQAVSGEAALPGNRMTGMILFGTTAGTEAGIYAADHK